MTDISMNDSPNELSPILRSHLVSVTNLAVEQLLQCEICSIHNGILIVAEIFPMNTVDSIVTATNIPKSQNVVLHLLQHWKCSSVFPHFIIHPIHE